MLLKKPIFLSFFIVLFSCNNSSERPIEKQKTNQITLIFQNAPINNRYTFKNGLKTGNGGNHEVSYVDDHYITRLEALKYNEYDTITIKSKRETVEITLAYKGLDKLSYIFHNGDSVLFTYNSLDPRATVLNREVSDYAVNYSLKRRARIHGDGFPENVKFFNPFFFDEFDFSAPGLLKKFEGARNKFMKEFKEDFRKELVFLDSLSSNGLITEKKANFYKTKRLYNFKVMSLQSKIGPSPLKPPEQELSDNDLKLTWDGLIDDELQFVNDGVLGHGSDSLLYYSFFNDMLNWFLHGYYSRKVGREKFSHSVNNVQRTASNLPDYRALYDTLFNQDIFSEQTKKVLLMKNMELLIEQSSVDDSKEYFSKFSKYVQDSSMVNYLTKKYHLDYNFSHAKDSIKNDPSDTKTPEVISDLHLISTNDEKYTFNEVLSRLKGKVVYVDFWASWCKPCIAEIPHSRRLQKSYAQKDVAFVFLSTDSERQQWKKSMAKYKLNHFTNSYLIANQHASYQFEALGVRHLPRYLLYDKQGKLVHRNAPRPSESEIRFLLDKHLSE